MRHLLTCFTIIILLPLQMGFSQTNDDEWILEADRIDPANYYGITVANGMVGLISSPSPMQIQDIVLNGVYDYYGRGRVSNILKVFNSADLRLHIDDQMINRNNITDVRQSLDMKTATFSSRFSYQGKADITYSVRSLRHLPFTSMIELEIIAKEDITIRPASIITSPDHLRDVRNLYAEIDRPHVKIPLLTSVAESPTGRHTVAASNSFIFDEDEHDKPVLVHEDWDHNMHLAFFTKTLQQGETYRFTVVSSVTSTEHFTDPHNQAERFSVFAMLEGRDRLLNRHLAEWEKLWESDIIIEGNPDDQKDIRSALYHLYSFAREGTGYSLSPMGLSGLGYNGHVFWDTDLWMFPPLLILQPEIAKSLIDYRVNRLDAARMRALSYGYKGAMFPWESNDTGEEATPVWALSGPFQHHITGVVAVAAWNYFRVTRDENWLRESGYPLLKEAAEFWVSRVEEGENGTLHVNNVVAADEWAENVDDNAFTNGVAIEALYAAIKAANVLGETPDPEWQYVADNIPILRFDDGTVREHATYNGEPIKQADVNLLSYPLNIITDVSDILRNLEYYIPRVGEGPAMTHSVYSALYSRLGMPDEAYELFVKGYQPNLLPPFRVIAETEGGTNPYFATGAGGMLQAVINGFGGLDITDDGIIQLETQLPESWNSLTITGAGIDKVTFRNSN